MEEFRTRIAGYDTGRTRDGFAMVVADITRTEIFILFAEVWYNRPIDAVARRISEINKKAGIDKHLIESNSGGHYVVDLLRRYHHINAISVPTVKEVKDEKKIKEGVTMGKYDTIDWMESARKEEIMQMPRKAKWSRGLRLLDQQMGNFIRRVTPTGVSYEAANENVHDDLVMALALIVNYSRARVLKLAGRFGHVYSIASLDDDSKTEEEKDREEVQKMIIGRFGSSKYNMEVERIQ